MKRPTIDEARNAVRECFKIALTESGSLAWAKVKKVRPDLWKTLNAYSGGSMQTLYALSSDLRKNGASSGSASPEQLAVAAVAEPQRFMSAAARKKIGLAQRRRWKAQKRLGKSVEALPPSPARLAGVEDEVKFCPHCAFPLGNLIRAANAMSSLR